MAATPREIAESFSRHRFADVYPYLAPDVRWVAHARDTWTGRDAVVAACEHLREYLEDTIVRYQTFRTVVGADAVAVHFVVQHIGSDGVYDIASCDVYDFDAGGMITAITSYTVAL